MVKVAAFQIKIRTLEENIEKIKETCEKLREDNVDLLCLPEKWNQTDTTPQIVKEDSSSLRKIREICRKYRLHVILGALAEKENEKIYVTSYFYDKDGKLLGKQRKIHLYAFETVNYSRGSEFKLFNTEFGQIGIAICFDFNAFPEVARAFAIKGADLIFNPVMVFENGIENWHVYLKSRALENRLPVVGINCVGTSPMGHNVSGESLIIKFKKGHESPAKMSYQFGKKNKEDVLISTIDLDYPRIIRKKRLSEMQEFVIN